jgi:hypothetical protein
MRDGIMQHLPDYDDEARSLARLGEYAVAELDLLATLITPEAWVVEAGSGFGSHALWLARTLSPHARVFLYEDDPVVARILRQNLRANRVLDAVTLPRGTLAGAHAHARSPAPLHTLDDLALERLDLVKIRAPHAEAILRGSESTLWRLRPTLFVRAAGGPEQERLRALMSDAGYRVWRVESPLFRAANFHGWPDHLFGDARLVSLLAIPEESDAGMGFANTELVIERLGSSGAG